MYIKCVSMLRLMLLPLTNLLRLPEGASKETMSVYLFIFCSHLDVLYVIFLYVMYVYPFFRINVIIIKGT